MAGRPHGAATALAGSETELADYWNRGIHLVKVLELFATLAHRLPHWQVDAKAAEVLAGAAGNENV